MWLGLLVLVVAVAGAVTVMLLVRQQAPEGGYLVDTSRGSSVFGVLGTAFAVILAFVILLALQSFNTAKETAAREAVATTQLYRTTGVLPDPTGVTLRGQLVCYGRAVIEDEWPIMASGRESARVQGWLDEMGLTVAALVPADAREATAYDQWFERDADRRDGRRGRLSEAQPFVPPFVWLVLVLAAVLVVGYMLLFADRRERAVVQGLMIGALTAVVVLGLLLVRHLDTPYDGDGGSIAPTEMRRTLALAEATRLLSSAPTVPPCDAAGVPLRP